MLRLWIEAQPTPVIALIAFGLTYLVAAIMFALAAIAAQRGWARDFKHIPPFTLVPLAVAMILDASPSRSGEQLARARVLAGLEAAIEDRRNSIMLSDVLIDWVQWLVIVLLLVLVLATIAMGSVDNPRAGAVALFLVASASGMSLFLLLAYDLPFNGGGFFLEPTLLRQVIAD